MNERVSEVLSAVGAVVVSLGGAGAVVLLLSGWLGKVWASRIMEREKSELSKSIEEKKAELVRSIEREKAELAKFHEAHRHELQELSSQRQDALNRRRDVYTQLATTMRVLLTAKVDKKQEEENKRAFLAAYDSGFLWAAEPVAMAIRDLLDMLTKKSRIDDQLKRSPSDPVLAAESQKLDGEGGRCTYFACLRCARTPVFQTLPPSIA
jgi:hypothetical protein